MIEETDDLIRQYYEQVRDKYPEIDLEHFKVICKVPFLYFKKAMASAFLPIIHIKYLGKLLIQPRTAKAVIKVWTDKLSAGTITEEEFQEKTINLKRHTDEYEEQDNEDTEE